MYRHLLVVGISYLFIFFYLTHVLIMKISMEVFNAQAPGRVPRVPHPCAGPEGSE